MDVEVDGVTRRGIFDTGATDSICPSRLVKSPDYKSFCAIKVANGNYEYSEWETAVQVDLGTFKLPHECVCLNTTAFGVCMLCTRDWVLLRSGSPSSAMDWLAYLSSTMDWLGSLSWAWMGERLSLRAWTGAGPSLSRPGLGRDHLSLG